MKKFLGYVFVGSCFAATIVTILTILFGILAIWMDFSKEIVMDTVLTWYLFIVLFAITGLLSGYLSDEP